MKRLKNIPRSSRVIWLLIVVMSALVVLSIFVRRKTPAMTEHPERAYPVELLAIEPENIVDILVLPGRIEPAMRARLPADKPGRISEIMVERGDRVVKDQLLLRLDARLWEAMLAAADVELREAEKEYNRWRDLEKAGAVSGSDMDQIRTRLDRARIQRDEAATHVSHCEVRSPADGIINERLVETGEYATEGMAVFELVTTDTVKIKVDIPERDALPISENDEVTFHVSVVPDRTFTGRVTFVAAAAHVDNNAFRMEIEADNDNQTLKPGMIAEVNYRRGTIANALLVPLDAVIPRRGEHYVYIANDHRAIRRLVRIDRIAQSRAVISDGLRAGDRVVIKGNRSLVDGALLDVLQPMTVDGHP